MGKGYYTEIWTAAVSLINDALEGNESKVYNLKPDVFYEAGNRKDNGYGFRTEFENGRCVKCANSAVARDLVEVLESSFKFKQLCQGKHVVIRMGRNFDLHVEVNN